MYIDGFRKLGELRKKDIYGTTNTNPKAINPQP